jgi:hypothetical protein
MPRCDFCFKDKSLLQPIFPKCPAKVCKACFYEIDRVIGFAEHYGLNLLSQGYLPEAKPRRKASKSKSTAIKQETNP